MKTKIYLANVDCLKDNALFDELYKSVRQKRQQKIDKIRFESDKRLSLGAELLLKKALSDFGIDYNSAQIVYGENGRPYIKGNKLFFSLSHSGNMACCAVSDGEIGVDIEQVSRADFKIAKRIFTESEAAFAGNSKENFIRLWTLKESYMKFCGSGLSLAPKNIEITFTDNIPHFKNLNLGFFEDEINGCRIALCGDKTADIEHIDIVSKGTVPFDTYGG